MRYRKKLVVVIAPFFYSENLSDGYYQRISRIDQEVLDDYYRIYLKFQEDYTKEDKDKTIYVKEIDSSHMEISLDPTFRLSQWFSYILLVFTKRVYIHCALRLIKRSTGEGIRRAIRKKRVFSVWDVHGAVPEEFAMHEDFWGAQEAGEAEWFLAHYASLIICVTDAMKKHLQRKYELPDDKRMVILPIISECNKKSDNRDIKSVFPSCVYAGGAQAWQNVDEMLKCLCLNNSCTYKIYSRDVDVFRKKIAEYGIRANVEVATKTHDELEKAYDTCDFGFALRDESIVNRVACPTKIIEYIQHGIIPVLKYEDVGDFKERGMKFVKYEDFLKGGLPNEKQMQDMVRNNSRVLEGIFSGYDENNSLIKSRIDKAKKLPIPDSDCNKERKRKTVIYYRDIDGLSRDTLLKIVQEDSVIIIDTFNRISKIQNIGLERIYCTESIVLKGKVYGGTKEELKDFFKRNNCVSFGCDN